MSRDGTRSHLSKNQVLALRGPAHDRRYRMTTMEEDDVVNSPEGEGSVAPELGPATATIELREEEVIAEKKTVQLGVGRIRRRLVTEVRTFEVTLSHEELEVQHLPAGRAGQPAEVVGDEQNQPSGDNVRILRPGETMTLTLVAEEAVVHKRPVVSSEVVVGKRTVEEVQSRSVVLRREQAQVVHNGNLEVELTEGGGRAGYATPYELKEQ